MKATKIKVFISILIISAILTLNSCQSKEVIPVVISTSEMVKIGGVEQYLSINGSDINNPILLFLHGGPGSAQSSFAHMHQSKLEDNFLVVNWDQRGAGNSYAKDIPKESMTIDQFISDTNEVVDYLLNKYGKEKIYIVGHSWGSVLGMKIIKESPEKFYAYIGIGQAVNMNEGEKVSYNAVINEARRTNNETAVRELEKIGEPPYDNLSEIIIQRKWLSQFGFSYRNVSMNTLLMKNLDKEQLNKYQAGVMFSLNNLLPEVMEIDLFDTVKQVEVPVYFCLGKYDYQTPTELAEKYLKELKAPTKELIWFDNSAHSPNFDEPDKFSEVVYRIYQETYKD